MKKSYKKIWKKKKAVVSLHRQID